MSSFGYYNKQHTKKHIIKVHKCQGCGARELDKNGRCAYCGNNWHGEILAEDCDYCFNGQLTNGNICFHCKGLGYTIL